MHLYWDLSTVFTTNDTPENLTLRDEPWSLCFKSFQKGCKQIYAKHKYIFRWYENTLYILVVLLLTVWMEDLRGNDPSSQLHLFFLFAPWDEILVFYASAFIRTCLPLYFLVRHPSLPIADMKKNNVYRSFLSARMFEFVVSNNSHFNFLTLKCKLITLLNLI